MSNRVDDPANEDGDQDESGVEVIPPRTTSAVTRGYRKRTEVSPAYIPSPTEQRMLDVALDPYHRFASVSKQCEIAGISRAHYYRLLQNPDFKRYYNDRLIDLIHAQGGQLVNIAVKEARKGSFPHLKLLLEMGGLYAETKKVEHEHAGEFVVRFESPDDD